MSPFTRAPLVAVSLAALAAACGIGVRRDLSAVRIGRIGYDDMCELQAHFDAIDSQQRGAKGPRLVLSSAAGRGRATGGRDLWAFESPFAVARLKRVLRRNWKRLPAEVRRARRLAIEVEWVDRAGIQRVVTGKNAELRAGGESWALPYHPCLSELLYGAPLYRQRRVTLGLPEPPLRLRSDTPHGRPHSSAADAGTARD
ncbi:MAG: hypothetical protein HYY06_07375 [Deltaproteobacteria bacterium]|nr:hypothetical protein [Deltaproteobacteria bacterium]